MKVLAVFLKTEPLWVTESRGGRRRGLHCCVHFVLLLRFLCHSKAPRVPVSWWNLKLRNLLGIRCRTHSDCAVVHLWLRDLGPVTGECVSGGTDCFSERRHQRLPAGAKQFLSLYRQPA